MSEKISLTINGQRVEADPGTSIIQAYAHAGKAITANVGCMGQGVCGSCRCMVRKDGERDVQTALACETPVEAGMQVSFIDYFLPEHVHYYDTKNLGDGWDVLEEVNAIFPEAQHCRHCGGCTRACPKGLSVEAGVAAVASGDFAAAGQIFDECVMCNLCTRSCPENIRPNHLGLYARRHTAAASLRPVDLLKRLQEIERGEMDIDLNGAEA